MPRMYRTMRADPEGKPVVENTGKGLGVRVAPVNGVADVDLDADGQVMLNGKGMSVAPSWRSLPPFLRPRRLKELCPGSRGNDDLRCFVMGEGPFEDSIINDDLTLETDSPTHGVVAPRALVSAQDYQAHLAATRNAWTVDET